MLVLILVDFVWRFGLGMKTLCLFSFLLAELFEFLWSVQHGTHHDLARHGESCWIHLTEDDRFLLARKHLNVIAGSFEWFLEL